MFVVGQRCFDTSLERFDSFRREAGVHHGGVVVKLRSPTAKKMTRDWASTKINCLLWGPKLGSELSKLGFTSFDPKLRSLTSPHDFHFSGLHGMRIKTPRRSFEISKPSIKTLKPSKSGSGLVVLCLFRRSPTK